MSKFFSRLPLFKEVALSGIRFWANKPLSLKLRFDKVRKPPHTSMRLVRVDLPDNQFDIVEKMVTSDKNVTFVDVSIWSSHYNRWYQCSICIDNTKQQVDRRDGFLTPNYEGSGMIGVVIFSLPAVLLCLPYVIGARLYYNLMEKISGVSRHDRVILNALKGQLDSETEQLLTMTMKNSWQLEQYLNKKLTFHQAKKFLSEQHLEKTIRTFEDMDYIEVHTLWYDDKNNMVARVFERDESNRLVISVLGSVFIGRRAKKLLRCYKTIEKKEIKKQPDVIIED